MLLIFAIALTSCASSTPVTDAPAKPLPADLTVPCPAPTKPMGDTKELMALTLDAVYQEYGLCGGRMYDLQLYLLKRRSKGDQ